MTHNRKKEKENITSQEQAETQEQRAQNVDEQSGKEECCGAENNKGESAGEELQKRIAELEEKAETANDKYVRMAAEFDNYRRRTAKEKLELISTASEDVIKGMLPVIDDFERALKVLKESKDMDAAVEGTELIYNKLMGFLQSKGLSVIEALGKELDTEFHEAVAQFPVEEKEKKNRIMDIVQQGYLLNGKVIRYAKVVVGV